MKKKGFTLIELLIVVAIIAILAAIAVPNFLEAQTRSKISRVRADARSAATALEAYAVDNNSYPQVINDGNLGYLFIQYATALSTPIAYSTTADFSDPFSDLLIARYNWNTPAPEDYRRTLNYFNFAGVWGRDYGGYGIGYFPKRAYTIFSSGPSRIYSNTEHVPYCYDTGSGYRAWAGLGGGLDVWCDGIYDASNGTKSYGGIGRFGGDLHVPQSFQ